MSFGMGSEAKGEAKEIHVAPYGRSGNRIIQAIHGIGFARAFGHRLILKPIPPFLPGLEFDFSEGRVEKIVKLNTFFLGRPEMNGFVMTVDEKARIARDFLTPLLQIQPIVDRQAPLLLHLRSGDIMRQASAHRKYTPLPLCFYERVVKDSGASQVVIVTEPDRDHPCLAPLASKYRARIVDDLVEGYGLMLGSEQVGLCISTFSATAAYCSRKLKTMFIVEGMNSFNITTSEPEPSFCRTMLYRIEGMKNGAWKASLDQKNLLLELPKSHCVEVKWPSNQFN